MDGKLIVIEGLDGSGKATQSALLAEALEQQGRKVRRISFPNYQSDSSALVKMYLAGEFGSDPGDVNAYAASTFFAVDRFASFRKDWGPFYRSGGIVIADRYTTSNAVHQCCKLQDRASWDSYLNWLFDFEYRIMGIPAPDQVLYLQVDVEESQKLMHERYAGDDTKKDIHEANTAYLLRSQEAAEFCAEKLGWDRIRCYRDGEMRSVEDIHAELMRTFRF